MNTSIHLSVLALALLSFSAVGCADDDDYDSYNGGSSPSSSSTGGASGPSGIADAHPSWLVGPAWTKGYKVENNIAFESEDSGIKLGGAPNYDVEVKTGKSWSKSGTWKVEGGRLVIGSESIVLATGLTANCRILKRSSGAVLSTGAEVKGCPTAKALSSAELAKVGTYSKSTTSGSSSSSSSTYSSYRLDKDGVMTFTSGSSRTTCYANTCKTLANQAAPIVSRWYLSGSTVMSDSGTSPNLTGYTFTKDGGDGD